VRIGALDATLAVAWVVKVVDIFDNNTNKLVEVESK
jgi:hypothetical protein